MCLTRDLLGLRACSAQPPRGLSGRLRLQATGTAQVGPVAASLEHGHCRIHIHHTKQNPFLRKSTKNTR